jgi:hypothetical protein
MASAGGRPLGPTTVSVRTSIVPPGPRPPPADTPGTSPLIATPQVTPSLHDFAGSLVRDRFLIRVVQKALMLSFPRYYLRILVHAHPLASVAVSGDRHSVSYSPPGSAGAERTLTFFRSVVTGKRSLTSCSAGHSSLHVRPCPPVCTRVAVLSCCTADRRGRSSEPSRSSSVEAEKRTAEARPGALLDGRGYVNLNHGPLPCQGVGVPARTAALLL